MTMPVAVAVAVAFIVLSAANNKISKYLSAKMVALRINKAGSELTVKRIKKFIVP